MDIINIEIKATGISIGHIEKLVVPIATRNLGIDHQIDTYYKVTEGRLKLREGNVENSLIRYNREEVEGLKESSVILYRTTNTASLKKLLNSLFEELVVVEKRRKIFYIDNVKIHLDQVNGLGEFVEIEAISEEGSHELSFLEKQCKEFMTLFGITDNDLVSASYSDLLLNMQHDTED